jgi:hypothetical protein
LMQVLTCLEGGVLLNGPSVSGTGLANPRRALASRMLAAIQARVRVHPRVNRHV